MDKNVGYYRIFYKGELRTKSVKVRLRVIENGYICFIGIISFFLMKTEERFRRKLFD